MELELRCVVCDNPAHYILLGYSYCKEHKDKHMARMQVITERKEGEIKEAVK